MVRMLASRPSCPSSIPSGTFIRKLKLAFVDLTLGIFRSQCKCTSFFCPGSGKQTINHPSNLAQRLHTSFSLRSPGFDSRRSQEFSLDVALPVQIVNIFLEQPNISEMVKQPATLAIVLTSAAIVLSILNFLTPKTGVASLLAKELVAGTVLFVVMPAIVIKRNESMSNFVVQKYCSSGLAARIWNLFLAVKIFIRKFRQNRISDVTDQHLQELT